jgi:hypothetical protein
MELTPCKFGHFHERSPGTIASCGMLRGKVLAPAGALPRPSARVRAGLGVRGQGAGLVVGAGAGMPGRLTIVRAQGLCPLLVMVIENAS